MLRDYVATGIQPPLDPTDIDHYFGKGGDGASFEAGRISFGEAKLLAFPVRSAKGAFALATCNLALQRFAREARLTLPIPNSLGDGQCLAGSRITLADQASQKGIVLEEYRFSVKAEFPADWEKQLSSVLDDAVLQGAVGRFAMLSDGDFAHFALNGCPVQQHVSIDDNTGTASDGGLFNEEVVPSEALFYVPLTIVRGGESDNSVLRTFAVERLLQFGGSGTTGLGYCTVKLA